MSTTRLPRLTLLAVVLAFAASACGGDGGASSDPGPDKPAASAPADDALTTEDDVTVHALEAVGATEVEVTDTEVRAHFDGSVNDAAAWTYCTAMQTLSGPRAAIVVYPDGELDCADRSAG